MAELEQLLKVLDLEAAGEGRFRAQNISEGPGAAVVFGGQLLAQSIVAGASIDPTKEVKTIHTIFARGAAPDKPLDIEVEAIHTGRALASATVTVRQGDRLCTRSSVLLSAVEPDLIRHGVDEPSVGTPDDLPAGASGGFWEARIVDGVDLSDPAAVGPPELFVWVRFPDAVTKGVIAQALLAYATDGFLIATAMRPHEGIGQAMSHVSISTSVLSHTLTFHEPIDASQWHLLAQESPYAGRGRSYGRANIFGPGGQIVASFVQDNMIRDFPEGQRPQHGERSRF